MRHCVIVGGGAALAQPLIARWIDQGDRVTAICRRTMPDINSLGLSDERQSDMLEVLTTYDDHKWPDRPKIDLLVTMAGHVNDGKLGSLMDYHAIDAVTDNLTSVLLALNRLLRWVKDGGRIVLVGSVVGRTGAYGAANYAAAKAGLVGLCRSLSLEVAPRQVRVNVLELGYVDAGMGVRLPAAVKERALESIPLGRFATPEEVVEAVEWLGRQTYMTGAVVPLSGGL